MDFRTAIMRSARVITVFTVLISSADSFHCVRCPSTRISRTRRYTPRLLGSKEEEIAKLEEQLRKLKEDDNTDKAPFSDEDSDDVSLEMFLTEQWKEQEAAADGKGLGGGLMNLVFAIGAVLALVFFSQLPIGQEDLSKYSAGNSPVSAQIDLGDLNRARKPGDL